jgi:hypothetical protein
MTVFEEEEEEEEEEIIIILYIKVEFPNSIKREWGQSGRFSAPVFSPPSWNPQIRNVLGAARQAVAGGDRARHRDREDVGPRCAGPSETPSPLFLCLSMPLWRERWLARSVRGEVVGDAGIDAQASLLESDAAGRPAALEAPQRRHIDSGSDGNTRLRRAGPQRHRRGRGAALGSAVKSERLQFWKRQAPHIYLFSQLLACVSSFPWRQITLWASIGRFGAANQVATLACNSPWAWPKLSRVLLRNLEGLNCGL